MNCSHLRIWFVPAWCGDFRLVRRDDLSCALTVVEPTAEDRERLVPFLDTLVQRDLIPAHRAVLGLSETIIEIPAPLAEMGPLLGADTAQHGEAQTWTAVRYEGGQLTVTDGFQAPELVPAGAGAAEAAATVPRPKLGCPAPTAAERRASQVLRTFTTSRQWRQFQREGRIRAIGNATGRPYHVYHRDQAAHEGLSRCLVEADTGLPVCVYDPSVPPEEEVLSILLAVQYREPWLRGLSPDRIGALS